MNNDKKKPDAETASNVVEFPKQKRKKQKRKSKLQNLTEELRGFVSQPEAGEATEYAISNTSGISNDKRTD